MYGPSLSVFKLIIVRTVKKVGSSCCAGVPRINYGLMQEGSRVESSLNHSFMVEVESDIQEY